MNLCVLSEKVKKFGQLSRSFELWAKDLKGGASGAKHDEKVNSVSYPSLKEVRRFFTVHAIEHLGKNLLFAKVLMVPST